MATNDNNSLHLLDKCPWCSAARYRETLPIGMCRYHALAHEAFELLNDVHTGARPAGKHTLAEQIRLLLQRAEPCPTGDRATKDRRTR